MSSIRWPLWWAYANDRQEDYLDQHHQTINLNGIIMNSVLFLCENVHHMTT